MTDRLLRAGDMADPVGGIGANIAAIDGPNIVTVIKCAPQIEIVTLQPAQDVDRGSSHRGRAIRLIVDDIVVIVGLPVRNSEEGDIGAQGLQIGYVFRVQEGGWCLPRRDRQGVCHDYSLPWFCEGLSTIPPLSGDSGLPAGDPARLIADVAEELDH